MQHFFLQMKSFGLEANNLIYGKLVKNKKKNPDQSLHLAYVGRFDDKNIFLGG